MVTLKWHCKSVYPILFLMVQVFSCSDACWSSMAWKHGEMTKDFDLLVGSDLILKCTLNSHYLQVDSQKNHTFYSNSSYLIFEKGSRLSSNNVELIDALTAQLRIVNATEEDSGMYHCKVTSPEITGAPLVCSTKVSVGHPPKNVSNFACISSNFENLTCSWDIESSGVQTKYTLFKQHFFSSYFQEPQLQRCPEETSNSTYCQWRYDTDPPIQNGGEKLYFEVQGNNNLGNVSNTFEVNHYEIVIPNPPEKLTAVEVGIQDILLHWLPPTKFTHMVKKPSLTYELLVQEVKYSSEIRILKVGNDTSTYLLKGLIPFVSYNISLRCRSNYTARSDMWSSVVSILARTKPDVPYLVPDIISDAFELHYYDNYKTVTLYWKPVPEKHFNADSFLYSIDCFSNSSSENTTIPTTKNTSAAFINFENLKKSTTYVFRIYSSNKEGRSTDFQTLIVDSQENTPPTPDDVTVISHYPGLYNISWSSSTTSVTGFTVLYCSSLKPWRSRCDGPIQWSKRSPKENNIRLNLTDSTTNYQFAVASSTLASSSGMQWATCIVPYKAPLEKIDYVTIEQKNSTSLKVIWRLNCAAQKAAVKNFEIVYCKRARGEICKEKESVLVEEPNAENFLLQNLQPYSNYSVVLRAFNNEGLASEDSDRRFQTTSQGAPADPPRKIQVTPKENASLEISWEPPQVPNGIITHYLVYYNGAERKVPVVSIAQRFFHIVIDQLDHYKNYSVQIQACVSNNRSPLSEVVSALTDVGVPGAMDPPRVEPLNSTHSKISWTAPSMPNGPIDFYEVQWRRQNTQNETYTEDNDPKTVLAYDVSTVVELPCAEIENAGIQFLFSVRGANEKKNETLFGDFSGSTKAPACAITQGVALMIGVAVGGTLALAMLLLFICKFAKWMSDKIHQVKSITVRLPIGLEGSESNPLKNYDNLKNGVSPQVVSAQGNDCLSFVVDDGDKNRHGSGSSQFSNSSADELIYKNGKCYKFGRKPSGESSGCSSMTSNATTRIHLSSDSGNESDCAVPPSPDIFPDQNGIGGHKPVLPILMEVHDQLGSEAQSEPGKAEKLLHNYANFMALKVDQSYSKFGIAGNPNSSDPGRGVNPLVFYSSNLANSEPSVFEADLTCTRSQNMAPYSKIGLAKSTTDLTGLPNLEVGYSKFGMSPQTNENPLSHRNVVPSFAMVMVDNPMMANLKQWEGINSFLKNQKLGIKNGIHPEGNTVNSSSGMFLPHKLTPEAEREVDSGYIKIGLSKNLGKFSSPGYVSIHDMQNLKMDISPDANASMETGPSSDATAPSNLNDPNTCASNQTAGTVSHGIHSKTDLSRDTGLSVPEKTVSSPGREQVTLSVRPHSIELDCSDQRKKLFSNNSQSESSNTMVDSKQPVQVHRLVNGCTPNKQETVHPISPSLSSVAKNGYVPLSHIANHMQEKPNSCVPNDTRHATQLGDPQSEVCFPNNHTHLNNCELTNGWGKDELSRCNSDSSKSPVHIKSSPGVRDLSGKAHSPNGVNYMNGAFKYILKPLPTMESEICEV